MAINAYGGAQHGAVLKLVNNCTPENPDCTWNRQWTETSYDALGRVTQVRAPDGSTTRSYYNEDLVPNGASSEPGETVRVVDTWGRETWSRTDALGRLAEVVQSDSATTYEYNALDKPVRVVQGEQERKFQYDSLGRLTHQYLPEKDHTLNVNGTYVGSGGTWSDVFTYDDRSNLKTYTDARGVQTVFHYENDPLDRLQGVIYDYRGFGDTANPILPSGTVTYEYMKNGDVTRPRLVTEVGVSTEQYDYNAKGLLSSKTLKIANLSAHPFVTEYAYDNFDRVTDIKYPAAYGLEGDPRRLVHRDYDIASRIAGIKVDGADHASELIYNAAGQLKSLQVGGSDAAPTMEFYEYDDANGLLARQSVLQSGKTLLDLSYDYQPLPCTWCVVRTGVTGQLTRLVNNLNGKVYEYDYDGLGRLTKALGRDPDPPGPVRMPYSPRYWKQGYSYDQHGNRERVHATQFPGGSYTCPPRPQACEPPEQPAPSDMRDGLEAVKIDPLTNRIAMPGFAYDAEGNLVRSRQADGRSLQYQYDAAGRLVKVADSGGEFAFLYSYGPDRKRLVTQYQGAPENYRTYYVWDGDGVIADYRSSDAWPKPISLYNYVYLGSRLLSTSRGTHTTFRVGSAGSGPIGDVLPGENDVRIGGRQNGPGQYFHGVIDSVMVFDGALSEEEVLGVVETRAKRAGHWRFDETTGNQAQDASGNGNHGTLRGGAEFCSRGWNGKNAVCLDGNDDYVQIGNPPSLTMKNGVTINAWIYPKGPGNGPDGSGGIIVNKEGEYEVARFADGSIRVAFADASGHWDWIDTKMQAPENTWTHFIIVYDAGEITGYLQDNKQQLVQFHHPDRLGTRLVTNGDDDTAWSQATLPFGTDLQSESSPDIRHLRRRFTSYDRDVKWTKQDYAVNRFYAPEQGRFMQVDPLGMGAASLANPQSLNMYAYVRNDPVNSTDSLGLLQPVAREFTFEGDTDCYSGGVYIGPVIEVRGEAGPLSPPDLSWTDNDPDRRTREDMRDRKRGGGSNDPALIAGAAAGRSSSIQGSTWSVIRSRLKLLLNILRVYTSHPEIPPPPPPPVIVKPKPPISGPFLFFIDPEYYLPSCHPAWGREASERCTSRGL